MTVDINYWWVGGLAIAIVLLITWLIKHDRKDEKSFEKEIIKSERRAGYKHKQIKDVDV